MHQKLLSQATPATSGLDQPRRFAPSGFDRLIPFALVSIAAAKRRHRQRCVCRELRRLNKQTLRDIGLHRPECRPMACVGVPNQEANRHAND